jgi:DNA ligase (NAD+)
MKIEEKYNQLIEKISQWNHEYYVLNQSSVSDREYDALYKELEQIEIAYPNIVRKDSPTQRVGNAPQESFEKTVRKEKMFSLENTYNHDELTAFYERVEGVLENEDLEWVIEPKVDGLSIECTYENGLLVLGSTRGDGYVGENVTENIKTIRSVPLKLRGDGANLSVIIRGEVYLDRKDLVTINQERIKEKLPEFKNPRNAAAGSLRLLDSRETAKRPLKVCFYSIQTNDIQLKKHDEIFKRFKEWGAPTHQTIQKATSLQELIQICEKSKTLNEQLPFDIDGLVIKINDISQQKRLGFTSKYPRWAIAYKYETEQAESKILNVQFQVGRTGVLTPVAYLEPVFLSGTTVARASLHNIDEIEKKDIRIGDWAIVEKAGEIIPQVVSVLVDKRTSKLPKIKIPTVCPVCGSEVGKIEEDDAAIRCLNAISCPAQIKESIRYFCSRKAFNIENVGPALVDQLVEAKLIEDVGDLFGLKLDDLIPLERMAEKSAQNVIEGIEQAKNNVTYARLLIALGIPHIGETASRLIATKTRSMDFFLDNDTRAIKTTLEQIHGIGDKMVESILHFFSNAKNRKIIQKLQKFGVHPKMEEVKAGPLTGKSFCITGKLSKSRDEIKDNIIDAGGTWSSTVTKHLDYLVTNETSGSSKYEKAKKMGVKVITEKDLGLYIDGQKKL